MKNNIITLVLVVIIGMMAFWYLTKPDNSTNYLSTDTKTTDSTDAKYIYSMLQKMAQVTLDDSIFSSQVFQSLKDNTKLFSPQPSGRNNPFAPIGTDMTSQAIQSNTSTSSR